METERRSVTVLFADLVGFTAFTERCGEEAAYVLMEAVRRLMSWAVEAHGGIVKEVTGDGIIALFGVPVALEDAPLRACRAALAIQRRLADGTGAFEGVRGTKPQLRMSLDTGAVIVSPVEDGFAVFGDSVNTAARLQAVAPPGAILLSKAMYKLVRGLVDCEFVGLYPLKGKVDPQPAYRLDAVRERVPRFATALARGLSPFSSRSRELEKLERILDGGGRRLRIVDIVGEPGIGKSRLLHELFSRRAGAGALLSGSCSADSRAVPFLPLLDVVRNCFDIAPADQRAVVARKAWGGLAALDLQSPENLVLLLKLSGFEVPARWLEGAPGELRLRNLLLRLLEARCRQSPVILFLEDLQWIDGASEEVLTRLVEAADASRFALVHTRRPGYLPPWIGHPGARTLRLGPLADADICRIVEHRLGALPEGLARVIAERAGGNPFFAEEIAAALLERRVLRPGAACPECDPAAAADVLPAGAQALLAARIDSLDRRDQALLRTAAAIGRRFDAEILAAVIGDDGRLGRRLAALEELGILKQDKVSAAFVFAQPLMRDMLYECLLTPQRVALHLKIAAAIERRSSDRRVEATEIVAARRQAPRCGGTAAASPGSARRKSARAYRLKDAEQHFARALEVAATFPFEFRAGPSQSSSFHGGEGPPPTRPR